MKYFCALIFVCLVFGYQQSGLAPLNEFKPNYNELPEIFRRLKVRKRSNPQFHTDPSVQHISSTYGPHLSAPKIPQFHTKNPSVQHQNPLSSTPKTPQFHLPLSSTPKIPQLNTLLSSTAYIELFFVCVVR